MGHAHEEVNNGGSRYTPLAEEDEDVRIFGVKEDEDDSAPTDAIEEHKMLRCSIASLSQRLSNAIKKDKGV